MHYAVCTRSPERFGIDVEQQIACLRVLLIAHTTGQRGGHAP